MNLRDTRAIIGVRALPRTQGEIQMIPERYASYEKVVIVGAANFTPIPGDKAANLAKIEANLREAAS